MDKALLAQALMYCGFDTTMAMRYAEDMVAYAQRRCEHRPAVWQDEAQEYAGTFDAPAFCGRCGKVMEEVIPMRNSW